MNVNINKYRTIFINDKQKFKFPSNYIVTAKYNVFTFLPVFLFNQFRSYSNIFFLVISIIQQIPGVSPMGQYTTIVPLIFILVVTGLKELYEDIIRHRDDKKINSRKTEVWKDKQWKEVKWNEIQVGEIVRVKNNMEFPADLLLICSSEISTGLAYVETVNLDGENNLKIRRIPSHFLDKCIDIIKTLRGVIICDLPNELIYSFHGMMIPKGEDKISINEDQILLRGAILRNTEWVCGIVIYTGQDTKIWRNARRKDLKRSSSAITINWHMMALFSVFFFLTLFNSVMYVIWNYRMQDVLWYLPFSNIRGLGIETFLTFAVGYSFLIPISLQIYLEVAQLVQASYINHDPKMYYKPRNVHAKAMTSNLNSDLGKVKYIFTDKTGTLTQNSLEYKMCSVDGTIYTLDDTAKLISKCSKDSVCHHFLLAICLCPGIIPVYNPTSKRWEYYSSSADQMALIEAVKMYGYELRQRNYKTANVAVKGVTFRFQILADIDFTNERRRSSVIVKTPDNKIVLYIIGSDDMIFKRLDHKNPAREITSKQVISFALEGLRTLCIAMANIDEHEFNKWIKMYQKAKLSLQSRSVAVAKTAEKIEKGLRLLGAVACEDKLQEDVPETIHTLMKAGIKIWMLTGDKQETAINIGYSTKLLSADNLMLVLSSEDLRELQRSCVEYSRKMTSSKKPVLIVNGNSLNLLLHSDFSDYFITLSMNCESVICYRMIPLQKALVVNFVQSRTHWVTLAIGDGANDVAMIQTATVGVGISGVEGLQAVYAADYSIAIFKHLHRLLFVHGTWNYNRVCKLIYYIYYKNLPIGLTLLFVSCVSGWSGSSFFDDWAFTFYNVVFTDGATLAIGIFEQDYPEEILVNDPTIYKRNNWFDTKSFYICLLNGVLHAGIMLFLTLYMFNTNSVWMDSFSDNMLMQGNIVYTNILFIVLFKCSLHILHWNKITLFLVVSTTSLWFPVLLMYSYLWDKLPLNPDMMGLTNMLFRSPVFWLNLIFVPFTVLLLDLFLVILYRTFWFRRSMK